MAITWPDAIEKAIGGPNSIFVKEVTDFGDLSGDTITMAGGTTTGTTWVLCTPLTVPYILKPTGIVRIVDVSGGSNPLVFTGTNAFKSDDFTRLELRNTFMYAGAASVDPTGPTGVQLFDLDNNKRGAVVALQNAFINFDALGNIDNAALISMGNIGFITYDTGLTTTDGDFVTEGPINYRPRPASNTTARSFSGTFTRSINATSSDANVFGAAGAMFDLDAALVAPKVLISDCNANISGGGSFFASGSLTEKDPLVNASTNGNEPDSATIGNMHFISNATATTISKIGVDFAATAFADAGGGQVTVSAAGHNVVNSESIIIDGSTNYNGTYTASNVSGTTSFEIAATFVATETGTVKVGFVDIAGTAEAVVTLERYTFATSPNRLTYIGLESSKDTATFEVAGTDGSSGKIFEIVLLDNGIIVDGSNAQGEFDTRVKAVSKTIPVLAVTNDVFKVMLRNIESTDDITVTAFGLTLVD